MGVGQAAVARMVKSFWTDKRVLVTGHTGFKGSWLSLWLAEHGARVTGYALAPATTPNLFEQAGVAVHVDSVIGDIRDRARFDEVARAAQPEIVFHLAAQALVRESYVAPVDTFAGNVLGTAHVLDVARTLPSVRGVVIVTTDKCYENRGWLWGYREDDVLGGHDPYSSSKACAELVTDSFRRSFFFADSRAGIATARAGNVIGGGDWGRDRLMVDLVRALLQREAARIRNPKSIRPWQHVLDVIAGYTLLAERVATDPKGYASAWNFGPSAERTWQVEEVANEVCARWGHGAQWEHEAGPQPHEARVLALDATKARVALGWQPRLAFATALDWTIEWYAAHRDGGDLVALSLEQIRRYAS